VHATANNARVDSSNARLMIRPPGIEVSFGRDHD
jgi:hypothetical protein